MAFYKFNFIRRQGVKLIDQRVNLLIERGAFIRVKLAVALRLGRSNRQQFHAVDKGERLTNHFSQRTDDFHRLHPLRFRQWF